MKINDDQKLAAQTIEGPVLILASAGTGKTTCLVYRLVEMIKRGISDSNILCLTFTNRAAEVMAKKVREIVGPHRIEVSTFHSFCYRLLKTALLEDPEARKFAVIDEKDERKVLSDILADLNITDYSVAEAASIIDLYKRDLRVGKLDEDFLPIYNEYQNRIESSNVLDFNDLLYYTVAILETEEEARARIQDKYRYILVDEFQDINRAQFRLAQLLAERSQNISVVGDENQNIYSFQGANVHNILEFEKLFPGTQRVTLKENYRSKKPILDGADRVIKHNTERFDKEIICTRGSGPKIRKMICKDEYEEARSIVFEIKKLCDNGIKPEDIAILYRSNWQSRPLESTFRQFKIPHEVVDSTSFYSRTEIKDITAYLQFLSNPMDDIHLQRIINVPRRGVGRKSVQRLKKLAEEKSISLWEAVRQELGTREWVELLGRYITSDKSNVYNLTLSLIEDINYLEFLHDEDRQNNVKELLEDMKNFRVRVSDSSMGDTSLDAWLGITSLASAVDHWSDSSKVRLLTIHSAKGTEFPVVFIAGLEEGVFPHYRSVEEGDIEEERRLCYVAMTRAMDRLYLSHSHTRSFAGNCNVYPRSRFLEELDD